MTRKAFTSGFLSRVVDTMLPGLPSDARTTALPSGSEVGVDDWLAQHLVNHVDSSRFFQALKAIVHRAGGEESFVGASEAKAVEILQQVDALEPEAFGSLLFVVSADYYESEEVLAAFGWRVTPPQPLGYALPQFEEALLAKVKSMRPRWRAVTR